MASGDSVGSRETSANCIPSLLGGSEESYAFECDACKLDGHVKEALYYCCDCEDSLCRECEYFHKRVKVTRSHEIVSNEEIKKKSRSKKTSTETNLKQRLENLCTCNQLKPVEFYCTYHRDVFCSICKHVQHNTCVTKTIDESCEAESFSDEFTVTRGKVETLICEAAEIEKKNTVASNTLEQMERACQEKIKETRMKVGMLLDKLEEKALEELKSKAHDQSVVYKSDAAKIKNTFHLLDTDKKNVEEAENTLDKRKMFITHAKIGKTLHIYKGALDEFSGKVIRPSLAFKTHNDIIDLHKKLDSLGTVISPVSSSPESTEINFFDTEIESQLGVDVRMASDGKPWITGIAFLQNNNLLIADHDNRNLILYETNSMSRTACVKCQNKPWGIAPISVNEVFVTFPYERKLQLFQIGDVLQFGHTITLEETANTHGVTVKQGLIYVILFNGETIIQVLDRKGNVQQSINQKQMRSPIPPNSLRYYVVACHKQDKIYLQSGSTVTAITTDGKFISTYTSPGMTGPRGLFVDDQDNILVCCHSPHNVHVFSPDGTKHKVLLSSKYQISKPYSIDFRANDGLLAIGDRETGQLHILKLT